MMEHEPSDSRPFVLEGTLTELHTELSSENLLRQVDKHYRKRSVVTGLGTSVGDLFGQAADSAMLAMYDGEYTENFICLIDDQVVCGTFGGASKLSEGARVKALVSRRGNILVAHALLSEANGLLWIKHPWGLQAERVANLKLGLGLAIFATFCMTAVDLISGPIAGFSHLEVAVMAALGSSIICLMVGFRSNSDMNALAGPATEMFRMLGFADPEKINLNKYRYGIVRNHELVQLPEMEHTYHDVYFYKNAIEDGKLKFAA